MRWRNECAPRWKAASRCACRSRSRWDAVPPGSMSIERREPGERGGFVLGLVGRTGSGKSTVARALERLQIERLERARGWNAEQARRRLNLQRSQASFRAHADVALENEGTLEALETAAREAVRMLRARRRARKEPC